MTHLAKPVLIAATLVLTAGLADARPPFQGGKDINIEEAEARLQARFAEADSDGNGVITEAEFTAMERPGRRHPGGPGRDREHRQPPSEEERAAMEDQLFATLDANGDGLVERAEFSTDTLRETRRANRKSMMFARLDENGDGALQLEELPNPIERLRAADADGDGVVTRAERRAARAAKMGG